MGNMCSRDDNYQDINTGERQRTNDKDMLDGINSGDDVSSYSVGTGINAFVHNILASNMGDDPTKYMKTSSQTKTTFYFYSCVAYVCRGDGVLGEKEAEFIRTAATMGGLSKDEISKVLKGKECTKEYLQSAAKFWDIMKPNASDTVKQAHVKVAKETLILYAIMASAQDGLAQAEYGEAKKVAKDLGLPDTSIADCIDIVKCEQLLEMKIARKLIQK